MERWSGKTAVVTGASAGIGAAICVRLADAGLRVVGLARRPELVDKLKVSGGKKIYSRKCDVGKASEVAAAFAWVEQQFGGTDLLVNNAGLLVPGHITGLCGDPVGDDAIQQMVDLNLTGLILCTRHAVASMKKRAFDGHIININSVGGHYVPSSVAICNVYPSTKHAVTAFTTSLTDELALANSRIKTTSISPGLVDTSMAHGLGEQLIATGPPMLRPDDVAGAVMYAVSTPPDVNILELTISPVTERRA